MTDSAQPAWNDVYNAEQLAAALDIHALKLAKLHGAYSMAEDIRYAAECIRDLEDQLSELLGLSRSLSKVSVQLAASVESLSKLPPL